MLCRQMPCQRRAAYRQQLIITTCSSSCAPVRQHRAEPLSSASMQRAPSGRARQCARRVNPVSRQTPHDEFCRTGERYRTSAALSPPFAAGRHCSTDHRFRQLAARRNSGLQVARPSTGLGPACGARGDQRRRSPRSRQRRARSRTCSHKMTSQAFSCCARIRHCTGHQVNKRLSVLGNITPLSHVEMNSSLSFL